MIPENISPTNRMTAVNLRNNSFCCGDVKIARFKAAEFQSPTVSHVDYSPICIKNPEVSHKTHTVFKRVRQTSNGSPKGSPVVDRAVGQHLLGSGVPHTMQQHELALRAGVHVQRGDCTGNRK